MPWALDMRYPKEVRTGVLWESEASRLLRTITGKTTPCIPVNEARSLNLTVAERACASRSLLDLRGVTDFVAVSFGGKIPVKAWGEESWSTFLFTLSQQRPGLGLVLVGSADERETGQRLARSWNGLSINTCGQLSPRESAAVIERATLFVGHDTGTLHLAAAVGTKIIGIYSARDVPGKWFSDRSTDEFFYNRTECFNCGCYEVSECRHERKCILAIRPEQVVKAADSALAGHAANAHDCHSDG